MISFTLNKVFAACQFRLAYSKLGFVKNLPLLSEHTHTNTYTHTTTPHLTIPHHTLPYHTTPYHTTPHHTTPHHTTPHHTTPHHTTPHHTSKWSWSCRCLQLVVRHIFKVFPNRMNAGRVTTFIFVQNSNKQSKNKDKTLLNMVKLAIDSLENSYVMQTASICWNLLASGLSQNHLKFVRNLWAMAMTQQIKRPPGIAQ